MKVFCFDTETTGIPDWHAPSEAEHQPHIVEAAAVLFDDEDGKILAAFDAIIKPDGWTIPPETVEIHGITMERALDEGVPEVWALSRIISLWRESQRRVCHSETFDARMARIAIKRFWPGTPEEVDAFAEEWSKAERYCTMRKSQAMMKAQGADPGKFPTLIAAHRHFTGRELEGVHEALYDCLGCARIYMAIEKGFVPDSLWDVNAIDVMRS